MSELVNTMPKKKASRSSKKTREILNIIKLEETLDAKKPYRFRMLFFQNPELNNREEPFVIKYVHEYSWTNDEGKNMYDFVTCPRTRYIDWESNPNETCPMCATSFKYFDKFKDSGFTDLESKRNLNKYKAKRFVMIPVYVVQDPNSPQNNGRFGVVKIREADFQYSKDEATGKWTTIDPYETIEKQIDARTTDGIFPFNANGVDLLMTVEKITVSENVAKPFSYDKIKKVQLGKKSYEISDITGESVNAKFGKVFDSECFTNVTKEELATFYDKHIGISFDVPDEDLDGLEDDEVVDTPKPKTKPTETNKKPVDVVVDDITMDDEVDEIDDLDDINTDDLIDDIVGDSKSEESVPEPPVDADDDADTDIEDLDSFLDDIDDM